MTPAFSCTASRSRSTLVFVLITAVFTSTHVVAQSISITDFRIPESRYQRFSGNLSGYWNKSTMDHGDPGLGSSAFENSSFANGFAYVLGQFSEERSLEVNASINSSLDGTSNSDNYPANPYRGGSSSHRTQTTVSPFVRYARYMQPDTWFWMAQGQGNGSFSYQDNSYDQHGAGVDTSWTSFYKFRNFNYSASAGIGYGKLRDGQPVFAALRVLDKLQEDGALVRPLSRDEILTLADTLARRSEYAYSQDRYYKFLMQDVFAILERIGAVKGGAASAFDVMRAFEVLLYERIDPRLFGWRVSASIMHATTQNNIQSNDAIPLYFNNAKDYLQLQGDYGYPLDLNTEISANGVLLIPAKDYRRRIGVTLGGRATYQVSDRIDASLMYSLTRTSSSQASDDSQNFARYLQQQVSAGFTFFIENDVMFNVSLGYQQYRMDMFFPQSPGNTSVQSSYTGSFSINYRFL
jgi:hypothetical protein